MIEQTALMLDVFVDRIRNDSLSIGRCVGIANPLTKCWRFLFYLGNDKLCVLYEKGKGVNKLNFEQLLSKKSLAIVDVLNMEFAHVIDFADLAEAARCEVGIDDEFFIYRVNIFDIGSEANLTPDNFVKCLHHNLNQIDMLEEGDIVSFERSFYHHHAIITDTSRMIVTHRYGEPEDPTTSFVAVKSILGYSNEKALVNEDHLIEVAGYRRFVKSNDKYDSLHTPRTKEEIVKEAKARIAERGYSLRSKNCQHFVSECRNGKPYSPEVQSVMTGAMSTAVLAFLAAVGTVGFRLMNRPKQVTRKEEQRKT